MCIILPVSHIPCTHTIAIWQHCIEATRSGQDGVKPCWNVKQHEQAVITRRPCEDCSGQRFFARRGGVAERGNGSPTTTPEANTKANDNDDDADDSGYHSDVIHEEDEASDRDECPLSPKALAPSHPRTKTCKQRKRISCSSTRKPSWKPNLKRDLNSEYEPLFPPRRDSIDSLVSRFDAAEVLAETRSDLQRSPTPTRLTRKMRESTLLHPSSPPTETTGQARMAKAFPFPQMVDVRKSTSPRPSVARTRKNSTLLHPSSPILGSMAETLAERTEPKRRPAVHVRRESSLLHPSLPSEPVAVTAQHGTIISIPPRKSTSTSTPTSRPTIPLRRMPPLQTTRSELQSATMTWQRRASVLHSCLSDEEDDAERPSITFGIRSGWERFGRHDKEEAEEMMLQNTARVARASRRGLRDQMDGVSERYQ